MRVTSKHFRINGVRCEHGGSFGSWELKTSVDIFWNAMIEYTEQRLSHVDHTKLQISQT